MKEEVIIRFDNVSYKYEAISGEDKVTLDETNFSVRNNSKVTIMGQNGAGKTTIFKLLTGELKPTSGNINIKLGSKIGSAQQMIRQDQLDLSVLDFFKSAFTEVKFGIERNIRDVLKVVNLEVDIEKKVRELSGGYG